MSKRDIAFKFAITYNKTNENMSNVLKKLIDKKLDSVQKQYERACNELNPDATEIAKLRAVYQAIEDLKGQAEVVWEATNKSKKE
jgi:hypothetical protein